MRTENRSMAARAGGGGGLDYRQATQENSGG